MRVIHSLLSDPLSPTCQSIFLLIIWWDKEYVVLGRSVQSVQSVGQD